MMSKLGLIRLSLAVLSLAIFGCGGGGSSNNSPEPASLPGVFTITTQGGAGGSAGGYGGEGAWVTAIKEGGSGDVAVLRSGEADAGFVPSAATAILGAYPLAVTEDTTIAVASTEPAAGTPYLQINKEYVFISDGNGALGNEPKVTGISVAEGATLTLDLNFSPAARLIVANDIDNRGTITTADFDGVQRGHLELNAASYFATGTLDCSAVGEGQSGGTSLCMPRLWSSTGGISSPRGWEIPWETAASAAMWSSMANPAWKTAVLSTPRADRLRGPRGSAATAAISIWSVTSL
jgi:hypothetical protein